MKRRLRSGAEYPLASMPEDVRNRLSEKPFGVRKAKRVRFEEPEMDGVPVHVSGRGDEATRFWRSDAPKTSEYAYFRKVRNGAVHGHHRSLHKGDGHLGNSKIDYFRRGRVGASATHKTSTKDLMFSFSQEKEGPSDNCRLFLSPLVYESSEPELAIKNEKSSVAHFENVTPVEQCPSPSTLPDKSLNTEDNYAAKGIFAAKRYRLRQWATQTLFSDMENHHTEGSDLVSALLSRLFPTGNMKYDEVAKGENDNISGSLIHHKTDNLEHRLPLSRKRDQDMDPPKFCSGRSREIVSLGWDEHASGYPFPSGGVESYVQNELMDHYQHSKSHINRISNPQHEFYGCLPFERYKPLGNFHFEGLDDFGSAIEHSRDEPSRHLLEWETQIVKDRAYFSSNMNEEAAITLPPRLTTTWDVHQRHILDKMLDAEGLFSASLLSNHHLGFKPLSNYGLIDPSAPDYGLNFDDVRYVPAEPGLFSLVSPKLLSMTEDMNYRDVLHGSNASFSHSNNHWLEKNAQDGELRDYGFWQKCLPVVEFFPQDLPSISHPWKFPQNDNSLHSISQLMQSPNELPNPLNEGTFDYSHLSSNFQPSFDTHINLPLLLNHVRQDKSIQEFYFDDDDTQLITDYRSIL